MARRWYAARSLGVARSELSTKRCMNHEPTELPRPAVGERLQRRPDPVLPA
jgi:hypothetical protein